MDIAGFVGDTAKTVGTAGLNMGINLAKPVLEPVLDTVN
jgi:hypothetical protein